MVTYSYSNDLNKTPADREAAKQSWINKLGKFYKEFDEKHGFVNIIFSDLEGDSVSFSFSIGDDGYRHDFMERFNQWVRDGRL